MRDQVFKGLNSAPVVLHKGSERRCSNWYSFMNALLASVLKKRASLTNSDLHKMMEDSRYLLEECLHCGMVVDQWRINLQPKSFSEILTVAKSDSEDVDKVSILRNILVLAEIFLTGHRTGKTI